MLLGLVTEMRTCTAFSASLHMAEKANIQYVYPLAFSPPSLPVLGLVSMLHRYNLQKRKLFMEPVSLDAYWEWV